MATSIKNSAIVGTAIVQAIRAWAMAAGPAAVRAHSWAMPGVTAGIRRLPVLAMGPVVTRRVFIRFRLAGVVSRVVGLGPGRMHRTVQDVVPNVGAQRGYLRSAEHVAEHGEHRVWDRVVRCEVRVGAHVEPRAVRIVSQRDHPQ